MVRDNSLLSRWLHHHLLLLNRLLILDGLCNLGLHSVERLEVHLEGAGVQGREQLRLGRKGLELDVLRLDIPKVLYSWVSLVGVRDRGRIAKDVLA